MDAPSKRRGKILAARTCSISPTTYTHMHCKTNCKTLSGDYRKAYNVYLDPHLSFSHLPRHHVNDAVYRQRSKSAARYSPITQRRGRLPLCCYSSGLLDRQVMVDDTRLPKSRLFQQDKTTPHHLQLGRVTNP